MTGAERTYGGLTADELRRIVEKFHPITHVTDPRTTLGDLLERVTELETALRTLANASDRLAIAESRVRDAEEGMEWPEGVERTDEEDEILARIYDESGDAGVEVAVAVRAARKLLGSQP